MGNGQTLMLEFPFSGESRFYRVRAVAVASK